MREHEMLPKLSYYMVLVGNSLASSNRLLAGRNENISALPDDEQLYLRLMTLRASENLEKLIITFDEFSKSLDVDRCASAKGTRSTMERIKAAFHRVRRKLLGINRVEGNSMRLDELIQELVFAWWQ